MKKIILTSAIIFATVVAFAQTAGRNQTLSPKEIMKMQVMKIDPSNVNSYNSTTAINLNLSQKEAMKAKVVNNTAQAIQIINANNSSDCPSCLALSRLSPKEKMKAQVVGLYKCATDYNINNSDIKCRFCGMRLIVKN